MVDQVKKSVNRFVIQPKSPSRDWCRRALDFGVAVSVARPSRSFSTNSNHGLALTRTYLAISRSQSQPWLSRTTNAIGSGLNLTSLQSEVGRAWLLEIPSAGPVAGAGIPAGGAEWVGTAVPAVRDLGFGGLGTARPTWGIRGAELSWVGTAVPAVRDLGFGGSGTLRRRSEQAARPTTAREETGKMPVQQLVGRMIPQETGKMPVQLFSAGNRCQPEVWIA